MTDKFKFNPVAAVNAMDALDEAFRWDHSPQGHDYWLQVNNNLEQMIREHTTPKQRPPVAKRPAVETSDVAAKLFENCTCDGKSICAACAEMNRTA